MTVAVQVVENSKGKRPFWEACKPNSAAEVSQHTATRFTTPVMSSQVLSTVILFRRVGVVTHKRGILIIILELFPSITGQRGSLMYGVCREEVRIIFILSFALFGKIPLFKDSNGVLKIIRSPYTQCNGCRKGWIIHYTSASWWKYCKGCRSRHPNEKHLPWQLKPGAKTFLMRVKMPLAKNQCNPLSFKVE